MDNLSAKMIELDQGVYVIPGNTNVGVITSQDKDLTQVYLVDSGSTEIDGEFVLDVLKAFFEQQNCSFKIKAIISTHCHSDHCGGHNFLKEETACEIWAAQDEQAAMQTPIIQSEFLWGGYPPHELRTVFFKPSPTFTDRTISENDIINLSQNRTISFIELHGHSYCSIGVIVNAQDGNRVLFAGDSIFPRSEIAKYWVPLVINPVEFMASLDRLCEIENLKWCIPSHGDFITRNLAENVELDKIAILSTRMCILEALDCHEKMTAEQLIKYVADKNGMEMTLAQYMLISATVRSYISIMHDAKEIKLLLEKNQLYFSKFM